MSRSPWIGLVRQVAARAGLGLAALACLASSAPAQDATPAAPESPARFCPKDGHVFLVEFDGLDAHAEAWKKTAAYKILNETPTGAMLEDLFQQLFTSYLAQPTSLSGAEALQLVKHFARSGFLIDATVDPADPKSGQLTIVLRDAFGNKELRPIVGRLLQKTSAGGSKPQSVVVSGHKLAQVSTKPNKEGTFFWWVEEARKKDVLIVNPSKGQMEGALEVIDGKKPSLVENPKYAELSRSMTGADRTGLVLVDFSEARASATDAAQLKQADALGLDRLDVAFGFQDEALLTVARFHQRKAGAEGDGAIARALSELSGPGFDKASIAAIPAGVANFAVLSLDPKKLIDLAPMLQDRFGQMIATYNDKSKLRLREDVLAPLGPKFVLYSLPNKAGATAGASLPNALSLMALPGGAGLPKFAIVADVSNSTAFGKNLDELMSLVNRGLKARLTPPPVPGAPAPQRGRGPGGPPAPEFRIMPGETKSYVLNVPSEMAGSFPPGFRPTIRLGAKQVAIAPSADLARQALEVKGSYTPPAEVADAFNKLPGGLKLLAMLDPRDSTPEVLAALPGKLQAGLRTAVQAGVPNPKGDGFFDVPKADGPTPGASPPPPGPGGRRGRPLGGPRAEDAETAEGADPSPPAPPEPPQAQGPAAGALPIFQVDPAKLPSAESIRTLLFPTIVAADQESGPLRITVRTAFPAIPDPAITGAFAKGFMTSFKPSFDAARAAAARAAAAKQAAPTP